MTVGALVLLSMYMVDRQWRSLATMQSTFQAQADDLRELRRSMRGLRADLDSGKLVPLAEDGKSSKEKDSDEIVAFARAAESALSLIHI